MEKTFRNLVYYHLQLNLNEMEILEMCVCCVCVVCVCVLCMCVCVCGGGKEEKSSYFLLFVVFPVIFRGFNAKEF